MAVFWTILNIKLNLFCINFKLLITINFLINQLGIEFNGYISDYTYFLPSFAILSEFFIVEDGQFPSNEYDCEIPAVDICIKYLPFISTSNFQYNQLSCSRKLVSAACQTWNKLGISSSALSCYHSTK